MARKVILTEQQIANMKTSYEMHGVPLQKLAVDNGVSVPTAARYLRQAGVTIRSKGRRPGAPKNAVVVTSDVTTQESTTVPVTESKSTVFNW